MSAAETDLLVESIVRYMATADGNPWPTWQEGAREAVRLAVEDAAHNTARHPSIIREVLIAQVDLR